MKILTLAAAAIALTTVALTGIAAPAEAAGNNGGHGGGHGYQQNFRSPGSIFRFFLPHGSAGFFGYGSSFGHGGHGAQYGHGVKRFHAAPVLLPARRVIRMLRRSEFRHIRHLNLHGGVYRAQARDRHGRRVNLMIDAYTGAVLGARYAH